MSSTRFAAWAVAAVLAVAVGAATLGSLASDDEPGRGEARLDVDGTALVERREGGRDEVTDSTDVGRGDRVTMLEGVGRLRLSDGNRIEVRAALGDADDSVLRMDVVPELVAGDALVTTEDTFTVEADGTDVHLDQAATHLTRSLGMGVSTYEGTATLDSAGQVRTVNALREMLVPSLGRPPRSLRPLSYDDTDPWDRRFLGAAMDVGRTLERLANGYTATLSPGEGRTPGFFRLILPGLEGEPALDQLLDSERPPGENLVGAAITDLGARGTFEQRWRAVFDFRDDGAAWGLVALDQEVNGTPLVGSLETAIAESPLAIESPLGVPATTTPAQPGSPGSTPDSPGSSGGPTTGAPTTGPTTTAPPPSPPPPTSEPPLITTPPPPDDDLIGGVLAPIIDEGSELIGGLLGGG